MAGHDAGKAPLLGGLKRFRVDGVFMVTGTVLHSNARVNLTSTACCCDSEIFTKPTSVAHELKLQRI